jgi:hypothetical protein
MRQVSGQEGVVPVRTNVMPHQTKVFHFNVANLFSSRKFPSQQFGFDLQSPFIACSPNEI